MAEYYNMVLDEDELHWFFDHIIQKPLEYETYMILLACRGKKLRMIFNFNYNRKNVNQKRFQLVPNGTFSKTL